MRVRFKGEADGLPCHAFGQEFPVGEWVEVEGLAERLASNPMFDVDGVPDPAAFDHDGDGSPGGSSAPEPSDDLPALRAEYQAVVGRRPFPGWGAEVLREKLAAARPEPEPDPEADEDPQG